MSAFDPYSEQEAVSEMRERMHRRAQDEAERNRAALAECESLSGGCVLPSTPPCDPPSAGVNDDLVAFGEIASRYRKGRAEDTAEPLPASAYKGPTCTKCGGYHGLHSKINCTGIVPPPPPDALSRALAEIESAHAACDSSWRRIASSDGRTYTLAEWIGGMRQMIDDYQKWLAEAEMRSEELTAEEEHALNGQFEPVNDNFMRIVLFFIGAIVGIFLAWGFLALS